MKKLSYSAKKAFAAICRLLETADSYLLSGVANSEQWATQKSELDKLDKANPEFFDSLDETRENIRRFWCIVVTLAGIFIDYFLLYNSMAILSGTSGLAVYFKILLPIILVFAEIAISYLATQRERNGEHRSWLSRNLQYFVVVVLISLSLVAFSYSVKGYDTKFDGSSFVGFVLDAAVIQLVLLICSVIFHLWIIKNAEEITEAIAYYRYKLSRLKIVKKMKDLESENKNKNSIGFKTVVSLLIQKIDSFKRDHPLADVKFENLMSGRLKHAINIAMGRTIFSEAYSYDSINNPKNLGNE
jgi:hypothetical protein